MSVRSTTLIARKSIRARLGRLIAIALAIFVGVSFVVGSFVLADSLRKSFDEMFDTITESVDLEVRSAQAFTATGQNIGSTSRDPVPIELADQVAAVDGVAAIEPTVFRYAQLLDQDGDPISTAGAPTYGTSWLGDEGLAGIEIRSDTGAPPRGPDEVAIDKVSADDHGYDVGDQIDVLTATGTHRFTITALIGSGGTDGFSGATMAAWDLDTAIDVLDATDGYDAVDVAVDDGADVAAVQAAIQDVMPAGVEVVTRQVLLDEAGDQVNTFIGPVGTGLLVFAFITAFVSAFLINNVFAITIGQRLRELALLRAVGASGTQVRRMIFFEALVMSVVATLVGILGGIGVARLLLGVFNSAGIAFPESIVVLAPRTVVMAFVVGVGITLLAVAIPAWRASRIPPVAAMRPELGFEALSARRLVAGTVVTLLGAGLFLLGIFARPGGTLGIIACGGLGALLLFVGIASVSATVARPVTRLLGWPVAKAYGPAGILARENAGRAPRRTSATAAALMIGVALVSAASVFVASLRTTFDDILERGVTADLVVVPASQSGQGLPVMVAQTLAELPEVAAVTPVRGAAVEIDGDQKFVVAGDPTVLGELVNVDITEGGYENLDPHGILVHRDPAKDLGVSVGDTIPVTFQNGQTIDLTVAGIFNDGALAGNWIISLNTLEEVTTSAPSDFFIPIRLADGVSAVQGEAAVARALEAFPQAKVQSNAEYREETSGQIDQVLAIITALLGLAIVIAVMGISITLALGVFERTREIGLMRAVGMTKRQTRRSVRWEAVIVSLFGALVGLGVGTLIGIALCMAIPDTIIDSISLSVPTVVIILIGAVVAGLIAALYPSYKASNMDVLEAIATE